MALIVLIGLFLVGDFVARAYAERRAAAQLQSSFDLPREPSVSIGGFPFLFDLAGGSLDSITVTAPEARSRGVTLTRLRLVLEEVDISLGGLLSGSGGAVRFAAGRGAASVSDDPLNARLESRDVPAVVRFEGDRVLVRAPALARPVPARARVSGRELIVQVEGIEPVAIDLPRFSLGLDYQTVDIVDSLARLTFSLGSATLDLSR